MRKNLTLAGVATASVFFASFAHAQTVTVCAGEYEGACRPHDSYVYCYTDIKAWAISFCQQAGLTGEPKVLRLHTKGGNKCGYSLDRVICQ